MAIKRKAASAEDMGKAKVPEDNSRAPAEDAEAPKQKKKRTADPGVRVQGGRIYDSKTGTTCHQCRQKTVEVKAKCQTCTLWWCPACLLNRYGEEVAKVNDVAGWGCPRCRDICNCSNCRKKRGLAATGILASMSKAAGFSSVSDLLQKNPDAKRPPSASSDPSQPMEKKAPKKAQGTKQPTSGNEQAQAQHSDLIEDAQLPPSKKAMPAGVPVLVRKPKDKSARWPRAWPASVQLPDDCCAGDLVEVLETLQVFGEEMRVPADILACAAAELLQPYDPAEPGDCSRDSPIALIHMRLLDLVRQDWGIRESVGQQGWQGIMRQYLRQDRQEAAKLAAELAGAHPATPSSKRKQTEASTEGGEAAGAVLSPVVKSEVADEEQGEDPLMAYPESGYWALAPCCRLRMLRALCCDALDTAIIRQKMDDSFDAAAAEEKRAREKAAASRREAKEARQKQRDKEIALLLAGGSHGGLTVAEQNELMQRAQEEVDAAEPKAAEADPAASALPAAVRIMPLGEDRRGALYWKLQCSRILAGEWQTHLSRLAGGTNGSETAVLTAQHWVSVHADKWTVQEDAAAICAALDCHGQKESLLLQSLRATFALPAATRARRKV